MKALYFDLATSTGWATGNTDEGVLQFGTFVLIRTGDRVGPFLIEAQHEITKLADYHAPELIAFESPILRGKKDNPTKLRKLYGLANEVEKLACRRKLRCRECSISEVRTHFLGKGYPRDSETCNQRLRVKCRERGWKVTNSDEANAVAGLDFLLSIENPALAARATTLLAQA